MLLIKGKQREVPEVVGGKYGHACQSYGRGPWDELLAVTNGTVDIGGCVHARHDLLVGFLARADGET